MNKKILAFVCLLCIFICSVFALSSCDFGVGGVIDAEINEVGELVLICGDGTEQNLGVVVGANGKDGVDGKDGKDGTDGKDGDNGKDGTNGIDGADGTLIITGDGGSVAAASAKGLRSAVSIVCSFETTIQQGGWRPGSSSSAQEYSSAGSGVIYKMDKASGEALIITNYHVVYDASSDTANGISDDINVYLYGSEQEEKAIPATYVGGSLYYDIAVLLVEDSDALR